MTTVALPDKTAEKAKESAAAGLETANAAREQHGNETGGVRPGPGHTIEAGATYGFVAGLRNIARLDVARRFPRGRLRFGYERELNDRDDLASGEEFFSYSPTGLAFMVWLAGHSFTISSAHVAGRARGAKNSPTAPPAHVARD